MSNRFLMTVAAAALIAGTGFANAQGTGMGRGDAGSAGSAAQQSAPTERGGASSERGGAGTTQQREPGGATGMKGAESEQKSMGGEKAQRSEDRKGGKDMKAEGKEDRGTMKGDKGQTTGQGTGPEKMQRDQGTTQRDRDQKTTTQGRDQMQRDQKVQGQQDRDRTQTQTQGGAAGETTTTGQAGAGAKLSTEQRTQITTAIKETRVQPVTNVNFSVSVGTRIPRDVTFHTLPERVVTIYPEWRRYKYILVKEQIVIVDPNTYEIVAVLDA
ncbi:DUF1236 domain-containing protein [Bradyrhizobium retamae]|nr:DUF1236 domain-containing protein [Bradyrhizobium retamae]